MMTYVTAFIFYTLAMIGILLVGFIVYKKTFMMNSSLNKGSIKILDSLPIGNKKTLLVVKVQNEKFLIASGAEHTTFLSKLENVSEAKIQKQETEQNLTQLFNNQQENSFENSFNSNLQPKYENKESSRIQELQQQFKELYEKDDNIEPITRENNINKKVMLKQLLRDINVDKNINSGSKF